MQAKLHKKYDLRSRKRSRNQENESEQQVSNSSPKATPQESHSLGQANKGKQEQNENGKTQILQGESFQDQTRKIPLEKVVWIPQVITVMKKGEEENERIAKQGHLFSLTKEFEKVRIQVPLVELTKIPIYQKEITEFLNLKENDIINDIVNM